MSFPTGDGTDMTIDKTHPVEDWTEVRLNVLPTGDGRDMRLDVLLAGGGRDMSLDILLPTASRTVI